jgi:hypothetical protein
MLGSTVDHSAIIPHGGRHMTPDEKFRIYWARRWRDVR